MRLLLRILRWVLAAAIAVALVTGVGGYLWLRGALPQVAGVVKVQGVGGPVEIVRDADGVPHVRGASEADALFGLGYAHAQDRLWQMEFQRRIGNGRLSEILGETTLETDKFLRTLGTARAAATAWAAFEDEDRALIEAYVAGINSFIGARHGRELPVEFTILGFEPEPWRPEDVLVWSKMMAWDLGGNWSDELLRVQLSARLGEQQANQLMPEYTADGPLILPDSSVALTNGQGPMTNEEPIISPMPSSRNIQPSSSVLGRSSQEQDSYGTLLAINRSIQDSLGLGGKAIGSNNWVIGGARTTTGKPLLANDPHLGAQIPSIWYLAHITGGPIDAIGATLPGTPGIIIGRNQRIAWGVTNTGPDVQDLFVERINDRDEAEYQGVMEPMKVVQEVIKVKGQPDVNLKVRITRHGPLISDVTEGTGQPLAFRWTALDDRDTTFAAFLNVNRAGNWQEFTAALARYHTPMQNFVYADVDGNIGYYAPGALPIRASGDGTAPVPGWTGEYDWTGYVPFEQLPQAYNPPEGYIVSANNKVAPDSYPHLIGSSWAAPYRAARIVELIESKPRLSPEDVAVMQADVRSAQAVEILPYLLGAEANDDRSRAAIELLRGWDGAVRGDSAQAAVFHAWYRQIPRAIFADELGDDLWQEYGGNRDFIAMQLPALLQGTGDWCDDTSTPEAESCATVTGRALSAGLEDMAQRQGSDTISAWRWDKVHRAVFPHNPFDNVDALKPIFSRGIPNGGDPFTVNVAPYNSDYEQSHVPSYRQIIDLNQLDSSRFIHTVGQSGQVVSGDYSNLIERWQRVEYLPMRFSDERIADGARGRLVLEP